MDGNVGKLEASQLRFLNRGADILDHVATTFFAYLDANPKLDEREELYAVAYAVQAMSADCAMVVPGRLASHITTASTVKTYAARDIKEHTPADVAEVIRRWIYAPSDDGIAGIENHFDLLSDTQGRLEKHHYLCSDRDWKAACEPLLALWDVVRNIGTSGHATPTRKNLSALANSETTIDRSVTLFENESQKLRQQQAILKHISSGLASDSLSHSMKDNRLSITSNGKSFTVFDPRESERYRQIIQNLRTINNPMERCGTALSEVAEQIGAVEELCKCLRAVRKATAPLIKQAKVSTEESVGRDHSPH